MTDLEQLEALLAKWGVPFEERGGVYHHIKISVPADWHDRGVPVDGYDGFYVDFTFRRPEGAFDSLGIFE